MQDTERHRPARPTGPTWRAKAWQALRALRQPPSLRGRTFLLLLLLIAVSNLVWVYSLKTMILEPRAVLGVQQMAGLLNMGYIALLEADASGHTELLQRLDTLEELHIQARQPDDRVTPLQSTSVFTSELRDALHQELRQRLGVQTLIAENVNGLEGLWVSLDLHGKPYWLGMDRARIAPPGSRLWAVWLLAGSVLSLLGSLLITHWLYRPLGTLARATRQVRSGQLEPIRLQEHAASKEINELYASFNDMVQRLARMESERTVMLAGISHDLRTPLSRLRLETEMSVPDPVASSHMAADIQQLDAIIDKFMDYARPEQAKLEPINVQAVVHACVLAAQHHRELRIQTDIPEALFALGDEVDLSRVLGNLIENARRYGQSPQGGGSRVDIQARAADGTVVLEVRDHGRGVPPEHLGRLTEPFFRGDTARTGGSGAGLGLAIVRKNVQRMQGEFTVGNAPGGGLVARIALQQATNVPPDLAARLQRPDVPRQPPRRRASDHLANTPQDPA